jgi:microcystin-dependent protein
MSDQFVGEIRLFAGNYEPQGWAFCDGRVLPISGYDTLYAVLGATYGGDGATNFALPDLRSRAPIHQGTGANPALSPRVLGDKLGTESETIGTTQLPTHTHAFTASSQAATALTIQGNVLATTPTSDLFYAPQSTSTPPLEVNLVNGVIGNTGGGSLHDNRMPYLALNYIIALSGYFPPQQ